jgi:predicted dehydrogenase
MAKKKNDANYDLKPASSTAPAEAPKIPYQPADPKRYRPAIGIIGCGGISKTHLTAYKNAGYNVVACCDLIKDRAVARRDEFFPQAEIYTDYREVLARKDIEVVDLATHPKQREELIEASLKARKHVLSQKPFVIDLDKGLKYGELAKKMGVKLAINQNGRWAPHFSYIRQAVQKGVVGDVLSVHMSVHWNHDWITPTPFNEVKHIMLYDFAIHWFDIFMQFTGGKNAKTVYATETFAAGQKSKQQLLAEAMIEFDGGHASLVFDGFQQFGNWAHVHIAGTKGTIHATGTDIGKADVTVTTKKGVAKPDLSGNWFNDGFHGTMGELLCSIEQKREPITNAFDNVRGLEVCFAAIKSAETGKPQKVGSVRKVVVA